MNPSQQPNNAAATAEPAMFAFLKLHYRLAVIVGISVFLWMVVYAFIGYQPKYTADSLVLIKDSAYSNRYVLPDQYYAVQTTSSSASNPVFNAMGLLKSQAISDAMWAFLSKKHPQELKDRKIETKADWDAYFKDGKSFIKAKNEPGTDLIGVKFSWDDGPTAKEGLDVVLKAFKSASLDLNREEARSRSKYLAEQVAQVLAKLEENRKKKSEYKQKMNIVSFTRESDELATAGIALATRLNEVQAEAKGKEAEYLRFEKMLNMTSESALTASAIGLNANLSKLRDQLYELSQKHAQLKSTLTDKNPKVKEVKAQIDQVESDIRRELHRTLGKSALAEDSVGIVADATRGTVINQMVAAKAEAIRLFTEADVLQERMNDIDKQIAAMPNLEEVLNNIEEEEKALSNSLFTLRQKELEAKIKQAETLSNVFVVDSPKEPKSANFPNQLHLVLIGLVMGGAAGVAAAYLKFKLLRAMGKFSAMPQQRPADRIVPFDTAVPVGEAPSRSSQQAMAAFDQLEKGIPEQEMLPVAVHLTPVAMHTEMEPVSLLHYPEAAAQSETSVVTKPQPVMPEPPTAVPIPEPPQTVAVTAPEVQKAPAKPKKKYTYVQIPKVVRDLKAKLHAQRQAAPQPQLAQSPNAGEVNPERAKKLKNRLFSAIKAKKGGQAPSSQAKVIYEDDASESK